MNKKNCPGITLESPVCECHVNERAEVKTLNFVHHYITSTKIEYKNGDD